MARVTIEKNQYTTYVLEDDQGSQLVVVPERGGVVIQWLVQGQELLYLDRERFTDPNLSVRGGIPILFPICGNLPDDRYSLNGQTYTLQQHGFARSLPWSVVDQQADGAASLSVRLSSSDQTRSAYPFEFEVTYTYRILGEMLEIHQRYANHSSSDTAPMPLAFGFHPYFAVTDKAQLQFQIPATHWQDKQTQAILPFSGQFDFSQAEIDMALEPVTAQLATVQDLARSLQLTLEYDSPFQALVFWTVQGKDFYCLEPWSAPRNALNTGKHLQHLQPGESLETWVRMRASFTA
jgi:galactose mutarotase-like enzyme